MAENRDTCSVTDLTPSRIRLDGTNSRLWSKIVEMYITGREKKGYITGRKVAPAENDPSFDKWEAEDAMVRSWLVNSMTDSLASNFVQYETAKEVWDAVKQSYLDVSNTSQVYKLMKKLFHLRRGGLPLVDYYNEMNSVFKDIDHRKPNDLECAKAMEKLKKSRAEERVYIFLAGLDHNLDQVSGKILATSPLPSFEEVFSIVRREEQRQLTMGIENQLESSALIAHKTSSQSVRSKSPNVCTFCQGVGHIVDECCRDKEQKTCQGCPCWFFSVSDQPY